MKYLHAHDKETLDFIKLFFGKELESLVKSFRIEIDPSKDHGNVLVTTECYFDKKVLDGSELPTFLAKYKLIKIDENESN
ncbi:MAG: hypothetical protein ACRDBG_03685 [Waterburya sp.]